jgi:periplasmic protein CpxP/Spy
MNKQKTNEDMKSTKTLLIAALAAGALLGGSSVLYAQNATNTPPAGEHGSGMKGRQNLDKQLDLTDAQKPKVHEIQKNAMEKGRALREDSSLTPEEKKEKAKAIREDMATQLKAVLTPEQFAKWQELSKRGPHSHPPGTPEPPKPPTAPPAN